MKKLSILFTTFAFILSHLMCFVVKWNYRDMLCGIAHSCYSAPAEMAFLTAIPYVVGIRNQIQIAKSAAIAPSAR